MARSKLLKRYGKKSRAKSAKPRSNPAPNPPMFMDLVEFIGPGFGAFAATRMASRVVAIQVAKRWPGFAPHAGVAASAGTFLAAWLLAHRVKMLERFHTPLVVGAGIATLQTMVQTWFPGLGWMVSDAGSEVAAVSAPSSAQLATGDDDLMDVTNSEEGWHVMNDAHDAGRFAPSYERKQQPRPHARATGKPPTPKADSNSGDDDLYDILENDEEMANVMGGQS